MRAETHKPNIFISYARDDDEPFVERLHTDLVANGFSVWWDRVAMESRGRHFLHEIQLAIQNCDRLVAVVGPNALASDYVRYEWEHALLFARTITPVLRSGDYADLQRSVLRGGPFELDQELSKLHCPDFRPHRVYKEALDELLRLIRTPVAPLGALHRVPALPPNFLPRNEELRNLGHGILRDLDKPHVIMAAQQTSAVHGMGGIGKSVLAIAFARCTRVRRSFPDGVLWLQMSRQDDEAATLSAMRTIAAVLGDDLQKYSDMERSRLWLTNLLSEKRCLIVIDDVWTLEQANLLRAVVGPAVRLLLTTRIASLVASLGAESYEVGLLSQTMAVNLLASWMNLAVSDLPKEALTITETCGNLPLAIAMIGALLRENPHRIGRVLHRLHTANLAKLERDLPNYGHPNLLRAMSVSVDALDERTRAAYLELAVFPQKASIPESTLSCFFEPIGYDRYDTEELVDHIVGRSLAQWVGHARLQLHDLQHLYITGLCGDRTALHLRLVEAYANKCDDGWISGPNDGYFYQHLPYHLGASGRHDELRDVLLSFAWLERKLAVLKYTPESAGAIDLVEDFERALKEIDLSLQTRTQLSRMRTALQQSMHTLNDGAPLAQQLLARLPADTDAVFDAIRASAQCWREADWLEPVHWSLEKQEGLLRTYGTTMSALTGIALLSGGEHAVLTSLDMYDNVAIIDLRSGKVVKTLSDEDMQKWGIWKDEAGIIAMAVTADDKMLLTSAEHESCLKVWDLDSGQVIARLETSNRPNVIATSAVRDRAVLIAGNEVQLWDLASRHCISRIEGLPSTRMSGEYIINNKLESLAVDKEGQNAIAGDHEGNLLLIDLEEQHVVAHVAAHGQWVKHVAICASSGVIMSGSWGESEQGIRLWQLPNLRPIGLLDEPHISVEHLSISTDGQWAVSASDKRLTVWNLHDRTIRRQYDRQPSSIFDLALTEEQQVVAAYLDGSVRVWDASSATPTTNHRKLAPHANAIYDLVITHDGECIASSAREEPDILLWDAATGRPRARLSGHDTGYVELLILPQCQTLVTAAKDKIIGWDLRNGEQQWQFHNVLDDRTVLACIDQPGVTMLACGNWAGDLMLWDLDRSEVVATLPRGEADAHWRSHPGPVRSLAFRPERSQLLVGTDDRVEIWDFTTLERIHTYFAAHGRAADDEDYVVALQYLPDGRVISASTDGLVLIRHADSRVKQVFAKEHDYIFTQATDIEASSDGKVLIVSTRHQKVLVFDIAESLRQVAKFNGDSAMLACGCSADASTIAAGDAEGNVHILRHR